MSSRTCCVGLVVVSHSSRIAEGTAELAGQMAGPDVRIVARRRDGGRLHRHRRRADRRGDRARRTRARAWSWSRTSAAPCCRPVTALELLGNPGNVRLSRGPIVEGAVIAAVQASTGSGLDEVLEAAEGAASLPKG